MRSCNGNTLAQEANRLSQLLIIQLRDIFWSNVKHQC